MESFLADLKKDVQCSLCNDTLIEPKVLSCFHTFCKLCIKRHAELLEEVNVFQCPKCKTEASLPEESNVEQLKSSLLHTRMVKVLEFAESQKVCSVTGCHSPASWHCFDCGRSLCDECEKNHSEFIKDHKVKRSPELTREDLESMMKKDSPCQSHLNQRIEFYCEDCKILVCFTCLKTEHENHKVISPEKFMSMRKAVLSKHLQILEDLTLDEGERQEQEEIASIIQRDEEKAKREVKEKITKLIEMLQENERELLRQIEVSYEKAKRNVNIIHHLPAVKEHINNVMEKGVASEMMNIDENLIFSPFSKSSRIIFVPNEKLMEQMNTGLGNIKIYCKTDNKKSTIDFTTPWILSTPTVFQPLSLQLLTKTSSGMPSDDVSDIVEVTFSPKNDVTLDEKFERASGKVVVTFIPKVAGTLTAEVKVNGNHVSNSPLVIEVTPQCIPTRRIDIRDKRKVKKIGQKSGVAVNKANTNIAVADYSEHCVYVLNSSQQLLLTYGSQGSGEGQLSFPGGLAFLNNTDLVIADSGNDRVCIVNIETGTLIKTIGKNGNCNGKFSSPNGVHVDDDGNIIVCDSGNHRVQVFTRDGDYQYQIGLTEQDNFGPLGIVTHGGRFYVSDGNNHVIHVFEKKDGVPTRISTIGSKGSGDGQLNTPWGLAIDNDHHLLVCDHGNNRIQKFTLDGKLVGNYTENEIKNYIKYIVAGSDSMSVQY